MKLTSQQLQQKLNMEGWPSVIWLSGDEALTQIELADQIRAAARKQGFTNRNIVNADAKFEGSELVAASQTMSLFGDKELIELRLQGKISEKGRKSLLEALQANSPDTLILVLSERVDATQAKAKWFNQIVDLGWWVPIWPLELRDLPKWLKQRFTAAGLQPDEDAIALMVERIDGNLLAAKQEIEKLALTMQGAVTAEDIINGVVDSSRYNLFDLSGAMLNGDLTRTLKILHGLAAEGIEPPVVLWLVARDLRNLVELSSAGPQGLAAGFKRLRIFDKDQAGFRAALHRASAEHYQRCLLTCSDIDAMIKGQVKLDPWQKLSELMVAMCQPSLPAYTLA